MDQEEAGEESIFSQIECILHQTGAGRIGVGGDVGVAQELDDEGFDGIGECDHVGIEA